MGPKVDQDDQGTEVDQDENVDVHLRLRRHQPPVLPRRSPNADKLKHGAKTPLALLGVFAFFPWLWCDFVQLCRAYEKICSHKVTENEFTFVEIVDLAN